MLFLCTKGTKMKTEKESFQRTELLLGTDTTSRISRTKVIIFGVGGVGSWCAESLIRSGIGHLTMVDFDRVCATNINRQLMATTETVGQVKAEVLKARLQSINPLAEIVAIPQMYTPETADTFCLDEYDYVIDAIDSLDNKALLIRRACDSSATLFASMGAALKMDPLKIDVAEFWKVRGCPLAKALRHKFKKSQAFPSKKFKCVYSEELLENKGETPLDEHGNPVRANGTIAHTTAIFGFTLAGLVIQDILKKE